MHFFMWILDDGNADLIPIEIIFSNKHNLQKSRLMKYIVIIIIFNGLYDDTNKILLFKISLDYKNNLKRFLEICTSLFAF